MKRTQGTKTILAALAVLLLLLVALLPIAGAAKKNTKSMPETPPPPPPQQRQNQQASLPAFDASKGLLDAAGKLVLAEPAQIQKRIHEISEKHNIGVGVVIINSLGGRQPSAVAREYLNKSGYNDRPNGGTLLLLAMQNRKWYFVTDPKMQKVLLDQYATKKIEKKLVPNMKEGKVADACEAYLDIVDDYTAHYLEKGSAYSDADPPPEDRLLLTGLGVITAALAAFVAKYYLRMSMSNVLPAVDADAYMQGDSFGLNRVSDQYLYTNVTRTKRSRSSGRSSSGGGGGGGGGGSW